MVAKYQYKTALQNLNMIVIMIVDGCVARWQADTKAIIKIHINSIKILLLRCVQW